MNVICSLGDTILAGQSKLGLENPSNFAPGLSEAEIEACDLFQIVSGESELRDLYAWRNGSSEQTPAGQGGLWLCPGRFMFSARECFLSARYCTKSFEGRWQSTWYPILTDGSVGMRFCDTAKLAGRKLPVFDYDPENLPVVSQVYDSIEAMLATLSACYKQGIYYVGESGYLDEDFPSEVELSRRMNPGSEYWNRADLY